MNKDLHDIDEFFRSVLEGHEETPSPRVKEKLDAVLDKKDAGSYKRRFAGWKRTTLLLLLLLTGFFVLYEAGILRTNSGGSGENTADKQMNYPSGEKHTQTNQKNNQNNIAEKKETPRVATITNKQTAFDKSSLANKIPGKVPLRGFRGYSINEAEKKQAHGSKPNPGKNTNESLKTEDLLLSEKTNPLHSLNGINITKIVAELANSIKKLEAIKDSILKSSITNNTKGKKIKLFRPFWVLTSFASYEGAGYRLDSDIPGNITSIKHSEVQEPSFSIGILITRQLKKQWGLQSGFIYSQTDIGITPQKLFALQDPGGDIAFKYITSSGYAYIKPGLGAPPAIGDSLKTTEGKHRLKSFTVPLAVKYSVGKNKLTFHPGLGIEANFLTSAKVETEVESPSSPEIIFINKLNGAKRFYVSVVADAELRYKLNNKLSVSFRPALRLATSPITENNVVETFPRSFGLGVGASIKL